MSKQNTCFFLFFFMLFSLSSFKPICADGDLSTALSLLKCKLLSLAQSLSGEKIVEKKKEEIKKEEKKPELKIEIKPVVEIKKIEEGKYSLWKEGSEKGGDLSFITNAWKNFDVNKYTFGASFSLPEIDEKIRDLLNKKNVSSENIKEIIDVKKFSGPLYLYKSVLTFEPLYPKDIIENISFDNIYLKIPSVAGIKIATTKELKELSAQQDLWKLVKTIGYGGLIRFYSGFQEKSVGKFSDYYSADINQGYDLRKQDKADGSGGTIFTEVKNIPLPESVKKNTSKNTNEKKYEMLYPYPDCVLSGLSDWGAEYRDFFQKKFTDYANTCLTKKEKLTYVSVGSGRLLQDIVLIQSLVDAGISFKNFVFIDEQYGSEKETFMHMLANSLGAIKKFLVDAKNFDKNDNIFEYFGKIDNDKICFCDEINTVLGNTYVANKNFSPNLLALFDAFKDTYDEKKYSLKNRIDLAIKSILNLTMYDRHKEFYFFAQWFKKQLENDGGIYIFDNSDAFNAYCEKNQSIKPDVLVFVDVHLRNITRFSAIEKNLTKDGIFAFFENSLIGGGNYEKTEKWLPGFVLGQNERSDLNIYWFNDMKWFYRKDDRSSSKVKFYNSIHN